MARYVVTGDVTVPGAGYGQPPRRLRKGEVVDLSAAEVTTVGAGNLRTATTTTMHDQLGESAGISNGN
jgi:hypothetical protein